MSTPRKKPLFMSTTLSLCPRSSHTKTPVNKQLILPNPDRKCPRQCSRMPLTDHRRSHNPPRRRCPLIWKQLACERSLRANENMADDQEERTFQPHHKAAPEDADKEKNAGGKRTQVYSILDNSPQTTRTCCKQQSTTARWRWSGHREAGSPHARVCV